jgi:hypothetical protein
VNEQIELVLHIEKRIAINEALRAACAHLSDHFGHIASRTEGSAIAQQHHASDRLIRRPRAKLIKHGLAHGQIQGIELTRAIESRNADKPAIGAGKQLEDHVFGG